MQYINKVIDPQRGATKSGWSTARTQGPIRTQNTSVLSFGSGSRTKMSTGKGMLNRAKREAREASLFSARRSILSTPTHRLAENVTHGRVVGPSTTGSGVLASASDRISSTNGSRQHQTGQSSRPMVRPASPAIPQRPTSSLGGQSQTSPMKRPAASVFLPPKKRKV